MEISQASLSGIPMVRVVEDIDRHGSPVFGDAVQGILAFVDEDGAADLVAAQRRDDSPGSSA